MFIDRVTDLRNNLLNAIHALMPVEDEFDLINTFKVNTTSPKFNALPELYLGERGVRYGVVAVLRQPDGLKLESWAKNNSPAVYNDMISPIEDPTIPVEALAKIADILFKHKYPN